MRADARSGVAVVVDGACRMARVWRIAARDDDPTGCRVELFGSAPEATDDDAALPSAAARDDSKPVASAASAPGRLRLTLRPSGGASAAARFVAAARQLLRTHSASGVVARLSGGFDARAGAMRVCATLEHGGVVTLAMPLEPLAYDAAPALVTLARAASAPPLSLIHISEPTRPY